eukprot:COSAG04_NODE_1541_length_6419_cov_3.373259_8_plen_250_part_00
MYNASSPPAWRAALTRKHNSIYDLVKSIAPRATVVQYGRGALGRTVPDQIPIPSFHPSYPISADGWPTPFYSGYYTGDERGDCFSQHLYELHQLAQTRQNFNATVTNAIAHGVGSVVPTLCLGCGFEQNFEGHSFSFEHNYSLHYSWTWGAEINNPVSPALVSVWLVWFVRSALKSRCEPVRPRLTQRLSVGRAGVREGSAALRGLGLCGQGDPLPRTVWQRAGGAGAAQQHRVSCGPGQSLRSEFRFV